MIEIDYGKENKALYLMFGGMIGALIGLGIMSWLDWQLLKGALINSGFVEVYVIASLSVAGIGLILLFLSGRMPKQNRKV